MDDPGDVNPFLYNQAKAAHIDINYRLDALSHKVFHYALNHNIPMVGIGRGATFLAAKSKAFVFQHVDNHTSVHNIQSNLIGWNSESIMTPSKHSTMIYPYVLKPELFTVMAWSNGLSSKYLGANKMFFSRNIMHTDAIKKVVTKSLIPQGTEQRMGFKIPQRTTVDSIVKETEVVEFKHTNCLCIQGDPSQITFGSYKRFINYIINNFTKKK